MHSDIAIGAHALPGILEAPVGAHGLVIFAHGSGSSRLSPRNAYAARVLQRRGFATLLFDLLTTGEAADRRNVFDIALLASRVEEAIRWARADARTSALPIGLFGASTGAAAAIVAATLEADEVGAVVSRGGRPDLAGKALGRIAAPTLLIVGGDDRDVIPLNEAAQSAMHCETKLVIVPGAGHLFEEPGTLDAALVAAGEWFTSHLQEGARDRVVS
ncbi:MAG TPA: dienelactone hydrolase family protein [Caulobacterales bacterium]|nr:dienelactone hydrolase family protein [Caulobacterales bacterium]